MKTSNLSETTTTTIPLQNLGYTIWRWNNKLLAQSRKEITAVLSHILFFMFVFGKILNRNDCRRGNIILNSTNIWKWDRVIPPNIHGTKQKINNISLLNPVMKSKIHDKSALSCHHKFSYRPRRWTKTSIHFST